MKKEFYFATVNETIKFSFAETEWNIKVNVYLLHRLLTNYKGKKLEWRNLTDTTPSKMSEFTPPETGQTAVRGLLIRCAEKEAALLQWCSCQKYINQIMRNITQTQLRDILQINWLVLSVISRWWKIERLKNCQRLEESDKTE